MEHKTGIMCIKQNNNRKIDKDITLLKYLRGLGHKSSLIISATCNSN